MRLNAALIRPALAAFLLAASGGAALAGPGGLIEWEANPDALVLRYEERSDKLAGVDALGLELWGDGRLVVRRPEPYADAGVHELRLGPWEMQRLLARIALPEVVGFDAPRVAEEKRAEAARRRAEAAGRGEGPVLSYRSEKERIGLELHLTRYRPGAQGEPRAVDQVIEWRGLRGDRDEAPGNASLAALASAVRAARGLLDVSSSGVRR